MSDARGPSIMQRIRSTSLGAVLVVVGAALCILSAPGWLHVESVDVFQLGVGIAFLGIAIG